MTIWTEQQLQRRERIMGWFQNPPSQTPKQKRVKQAHMNKQAKARNITSREMGKVFPAPKPPKKKGK